MHDFEQMGGEEKVKLLFSLYGRVLSSKQNGQHPHQSSCACQQEPVPLRSGFFGLPSPKEG